jgi:hypothetical protein
MVVLPLAVAVSMSTFAAALMVILGNGIGYAVSHVVTLPMSYFLAHRYRSRT